MKFGTADIGASRTERSQMDYAQLRPPTQKQLDYADHLIDELRICGCGEAEDYADRVREATKIGQMSELIDGMLQELDGHDYDPEEELWDGKDW